MIPTTEIIYNYEYAKRLYRGTGNFENVWRRIVEVGAGFEAIYNESIEFILTDIAKYSGFAWEEYADDYFPIYLAEISPSLAHPFTLNVNEDAETMLEDFIYQLVHRNMFFGFVSDAERDQCYRSVTDHVLADLKIRVTSRDCWDLRNKTAKEYLKK